MQSVMSNATTVLKNGT